MNSIHGDSLIRIAEQNQLSHQQYTDFSCNINPLKHPDGFQEHLISTLSEIRLYPDSEYTKLKQLLGRYSGYPVEYCIPANGGIEALYYYSLYALYKKVLIVSPTFSEYERMLSNRGADIHYFMLREENNFIVDVDSLYDEAEKGYDLVVLCNPNNPTGTMLSPVKLDSFIQKIKGINVNLLLDESFIEFTGEGNRKTVYSDNVFVIRSLTKFFGIPGLRAGFGVTSNRELTVQINNSIPPWNVNCIARRACEYLLENEKFIDDSFENIQNEKAFCISRLEEIKEITVFPSSANFLLLKLSGVFKKDELIRYLHNRLIIVRDCASFRGLENGYIRIAVKNRRDNLLLLEALSDFKKL
ncbi:MAG: hypothetical protein A2015_11140 [Spirochaetes bacterium GWF1_31_7]|nr:MAG: hypothetical protein A2Y30_02375 [Spirochaetes bacterium GWE1_32_154]OHD46378.1 MAG: hypothetical protein A2Y29_04235 [Spirochaetes bacterium GWE2_31_10]OHD47755.1 MAG: hypothetical protein A2015_11140 [Spirochaetes bacterium GWF1_31_7]HBD95606.1 hypothetical protein [Spirochaetia bacterium]HBI37481.1 hypothetical protein [Spirochaetia bacterium]